MPDRRPVYPELTQAQWEVLSALTDQRCANILEGADFIHDLSEEAKEFLRKADKQKIRNLNSTLDSWNAAGIIWKFIWVGGATAFGLFVGITQFWDAVSKYLKVTLK